MWSGRQRLRIPGGGGGGGGGWGRGGGGGWVLGGGGKEREAIADLIYSQASVSVFGHDVTAARDQRRLALALLDFGRQLHLDFSPLAVARRIGRLVGE